MRIVFVILLVFFASIVNGQTRPSGFPTQLSSGWFRQGYQQSDSGTIVANRDTLGWLPRFNGTIVLRPQDKELYFYDSTQLRWFRLLKSGSVSSVTASNGLTKVSDDIRLGGNLTQNTTINGRGLYELNSDSLFSFDFNTIYPYQFLGEPYYMQNSIVSFEPEQSLKLESIGNNLSPDTTVYATSLSINPQSLQILSIDNTNDSNSSYAFTTTEALFSSKLGIAGFSNARLHVGGTGIFTDTLTATTMSNSDSSNRVATTALLKRLISGTGSGTVTNVGTGLWLSGGPINTTGTIIADSAAMALYFLRRKDSTLYATQYDLTQITASGVAGGDLTGTYPNPRFAHSTTGTGNFLQVKNSVVVGDTIVRLGQIFNDNFARASLGSNYGTSGSQTVSFPSSAYLQITGSLDYTNNIFRQDYTGVNRWIDSVRFTTGAVGGTTYGLIINVYDPVNYQTGIRVQFGCATSLTNIFFRFYDGTQLASGSGNLGITGGDSLLAIVERRDNTFICTYRNLTTGAAAVTLTYTFSTLTSAAQPSPATGRMAIGSLGGVQNVSYWSHTSSEVKNQFSVAGNSIASGGYTATVIGNSYPNKVFYTRDQWARLGGAGDRSIDAINYIPQLRALAPRIIYYTLGVNDALNSVTGADYSTNVQRFLDSCTAIGITPILVQLPPQNTVLSKPYSDTLQAIASRRGLTFITGIYDALRTGTAYNASYSTDGIHPNDAGHLIIANLIKAQSSSVNYNLTLLNIPADSTATSRVVQIEEDGHTTVGVFANTLQIIGNPVRVGAQLILSGGGTPAISSTLSSPNGFVNIVQNSSTTGWSGEVYYNAAGALKTAVGWQNSGVASGNGAVSDSTFLFKTYNVATGRFAFFGGDNQTSNAFADLLIYRGSILPGRHVAAGRTVNPISGMFYFDTDSSDYVYFNGTAWRRYSSVATGSTTTLYTGNGTLTGARTVTMGGNNINFSGGDIGIDIAPLYDFHIENSTATAALVSTTALGATSGGVLGLYADALPTASGQRIGYLSFRSAGGAANDYEGGAVSVVSRAAWTGGSSHSSSMSFLVTASGNSTPTTAGTAAGGGRWFFGGSTISTDAWAQLAAGTTSTAPLKFNSGTDPSSPNAGMMVFNGTRWAMSPSTTLLRVPLFNDVTPTSGSILVGDGTNFTLQTQAATYPVQSYTPTFTGTANVTGTTASTVYYQRIGDKVHVWGVFGIDPTSATTLTTCGMSLPVASTFSGAGLLSGSGYSDSIAQGVAIRADTANNRAEIIFFAAEATDSNYRFEFSYQITPP